VSRSRFLRLAAGALLPFVGLRLSAAAPNPEPAHNSGAPGTKGAAGPGRMGAILVSQFGPVKIHSYLRPANGFQVNTQMIGGRHLRWCCRMPTKLRHTCRRSGKPVDRINSLACAYRSLVRFQVLTERFPDARVFALGGVADQVRARGPARLDSSCDPTALGCELAADLNPLLAHRALMSPFVKRASPCRVELAHIALADSLQNTSTRVVGPESHLGPVSRASPVWTNNSDPDVLGLST
jgi:hypothetical protein